VRLIFFIGFILLIRLGLAQQVWMHPNHGQWEEEVLYKVELNHGAAFIESQGMSMLFSNFGQHHHDHHEGENHSSHEEVLFHAIKVKHRNALNSNKIDELGKSTFYRNYLLGADKEKWKTNVFAVNQVRIDGLYEGITQEYVSSDYGLKYSYFIEPGVDPGQIVVDYTGQHALFLDEEGNLHATHSFGEVIESAPIAWTVKNGKRKAVSVSFKILGNALSYELPDGYDMTDTLVIDPNLTFSTFSGSTADNWGFTACPDLNGNLFGAGVVMGMGYPITAGTFDSTYNGGYIDVAISKFSATGSNLMYSTYLGGTGSETPNSIVANDAGELFIFGVTSSTNFPMAGTPYDNSYNGGPPIGNNLTNNLDFTGGTDLFVARLSVDGSSLLASTYVGGSGNDGCNITNLKFNYGDQYRGEIVVDDLNNVYVSSMTQSGNFPVVLGSQGAISGSQDAVLFKMNGALSTMLWSTFYGGSGVETGNSIQLSSNGNVYVAGGTTSGDLMVTGGHDQSANGGTDGYVARFNGTNGTFLSGSYIGSPEYDQAFFVQLDIDNQVYVLGQSESDLGISAGLYGNANSGQFIRKFNTNLSAMAWNTMIGAGSGHVEISPTAFLVSDCYDIYLSGWGGVLNANPNVSQAVNSTTFGFPVTVDAYQPNTNGSNFYIAVLGQDANMLKYGTYFGGTSSSDNHVDGGTSRFDKSGRIYHAVCGACGGVPNGFTTTPGVWSPFNQSGNCNLAAFKFELSTIEAVVGNPDPLVCLPDPVLFNNNSSNGNQFFWDFGDGSTSNEVNPSHVYPGPGTYDVTLVVSDSNGCFSPDSVNFEVFIGEFNGGVTDPGGAICPGESIQLEAFGGSNYVWSPQQFLDDPFSATPTATVFQTTDFQVIISDSCGIDTVAVTVVVFDGDIQASNDTSICIGNSVQLFVNGGSFSQWSPPTFLDDPSSSTPISIPDSDISYTVEIETASGCILRDTVNINVFYTPPIPILPDSLFVCQGSPVSVTAFGGETYFWFPDNSISDVTSATVEILAPSSQYYYCLMSNVCGDTLDSLWIELVQASITAGNDTTICPGNTATLWAQGGLAYYWWPSIGLSTFNTSLVNASPLVPTMYYVIGTDNFGCTAVDSVFVDLFPQAILIASPDVYAFFGDEVELSASTSTVGTIVWTPTEFLSCVACPTTIANPDQDYTYVASYVDINGCSSSDTVRIYYDPILYVPNTFTPNADENNQVFRAYGGNIKSFEMTIYNRWGELVFTGDDLSDFWDGSYNDYPCQDGTYTWKVKLVDLKDEEHLYVGHVNLIR
jgi:gliding motility-associated-like protein